MMPGRSGMVPTALEAAVTATQRVRGESTASTAAAGSSRVSRSGSAKRTSTPARAAAMSHGATLASWSRRVKTISSPGCSERHAAAAKRMVSAVIEGPKTTPSGPAPSSRATEARASSTSASVRSAAWKAPPWLAPWPERIQAAISSMASSTIWVPAAPSRRAQPSLRPGKRVRCMAADPSTVPRHATGRLRRDLAVLRAPRRRRAAAADPGDERDAPGLGRAVPGRLARDFDVVAYDHRGIGRTRRRSRRAVHDRRARRRRRGPARRPRLGVARTCSGISMGGMVAQELALRHPERIRTLTLGCTYCGGPEAPLADPAVIQERLGAHAVRRPRAGAAHRLRGQRVGRVRAEDGALRAVPRDGQPLPVAGRRDHAADAGGRRARHERAPARRSRRPTLVVHGDEDQMLPVVNGQRSRARSRTRGWRSSTASGTCSGGSSPSAARRSCAR